MGKDVTFEALPGPRPRVRQRGEPARDSRAGRPRSRPGTRPSTSCGPTSTEPHPSARSKAGSGGVYACCPIAPCFSQLPAPTGMAATPKRHVDRWCRCRTGSISAIDGIDDGVEIGHGGFGSVFRAHQPEPGRTVAVRILPVRPEFSLRDRYRRECGSDQGRLASTPTSSRSTPRASRRLEQPCLVMEYVPNGSLGRPHRARRSGAVGRGRRRSR